jgi:syntaxin 16
MESDADKSFSQTMLMQTSQRQAGVNDAAIAQREREINDIAKGIIELSDIFRELQSMIIDQGTMLDRIDYNVEKMNTDVKSADTELKVVSFLLWSDAVSLLSSIGQSCSNLLSQATNYQRRTTKRKAMLLLALVVIGLIILLVIKPKKSSSPSPPPEDESSNNIRAVIASVDRLRRHSSSRRFARDRWMDPDIFR